MRSSSLLLALGALAIADPTWPSETDELEEIMYQLFSYGARNFADTVSPCSNEASGPGRQNAAEWLRTAFHDAATANTYFGTGGVDGSLQYELENGENSGPGHKTTLQFMAPYVSPRASLADLIALGVYTSVRSCGGPVVPFRAGRRDAVAAGNPGVPQPQNSAFTFQQQFERLGFTKEDMIQLTACGHTLGGVHQTEFPELMPEGGVRNGEAPFDSAVDKFGPNVVTEYLAGKTVNPLVGGPSAKVNKNSDFKVFNSDGNKTVRAMADPDVFRATCQRVLQKMIDLVPPTVTLSDPITPYAVKPVGLQLTLADGGSSLVWTGRIRVKTTGLSADAIKSVSITYKDRTGGCASSSCTLGSTVQGVGRGFDDSFAFFPIEVSIPASSGISSFVVTLHRADGSSTLYDNNGQGYPMHDDVVFQAPQSCVRPSTGSLTVVAAVRNDVAAGGARADVWYHEPQSNSPVPRLSRVGVALEKRRCVGHYTLFTTDYAIQGGLASQSHVDVLAGSRTDSFKSLAGVGGTCAEFDRAAPCVAAEQAFKTLGGRAVNSSVPTTALVPPTPTPAVVAQHRPAVGGYRLVSCWTEGNKTRALSGTTFTNDTMTLDKCMEFCSKYNYWGTEYGRECYCGNSLSPSSNTAPLSDCNMPCGGNGSEYCGAGDRLELYSTTSAPATPTPTATLTHKTTVSSYTLMGCMAEPTSARALSHKTTLAGKTTTNEACAAACAGSRYFGTEYGNECYCGTFVNAGARAAPLTDCSMACAGDAYQYCGGADRLELYENANATGGTPQQPPAVADFVLVGCRTEGNGTRALGGRVAAADDMTNAKCAGFCGGATFFGTEYGRECYCGDGLDASSKEAPALECGMPCAGDATQLCGASNRLSVYRRRGPPTTPPTPPPSLKMRRRR